MNLLTTWAVVLVVAVVYGPHGLMRSRVSDHIQEAVGAQDAEGTAFPPAGHV